jgi:predicted amidohydrolase
MIQTDVAWEDPTANLMHCGKLLRTLRGTTDLAVLPELFTTGSILRPELAETTDGETVATLKQWATGLGMAIAGSFLATENRRYYNRLFFVTPEGDPYHADKRHLFRMGGEDRRLSAGTRRLIVAYRGWKICPLVCYDLRFPVWSRNAAGNDYDLLLYTANWPAPRGRAWQVLLPARAVENLAYVCGVNRTGVDGQGIAYRGHSAVCSPKGEYVAEAGETETVLTCTLDRAALDALRTRFPVWKDADAFTVHTP